MFDSPSLQELIEFKWDTFSFYHHSVNFFMQFGQMCVLSYYTVHVYINNDLELSAVNLDQGKPNNFALFLPIGIIYPVLYESA